MAERHGPRAKGVCPDCGRVISGRAVGIQVLAADRRWVILSPHNRAEYARHPVVCLARGARRVVPRIPDGQPGWADEDAG